LRGEVPSEWWGYTSLPGGLAPYLNNNYGRWGIRRCLSHPVLVAGDFNAWAVAWGCRQTKLRGEILLNWAAELDLLILNRGSTCVRARGESVVDLTLATPLAARLVSSWGILYQDTRRTTNASRWS